MLAAALASSAAVPECAPEPAKKERTALRARAVERTAKTMRVHATQMCMIS